MASVSVMLSSITKSGGAKVSNATACGFVLGNPSRMNPFWQSGFAKRSFTIWITTSSDTKIPLEVRDFTFFPRGVLFFMFSLKMSPVEM